MALESVRSECHERFRFPPAFQRSARNVAGCISVGMSYPLHADAACEMFSELSKLVTEA